MLRGTPGASLTSCPTSLSFACSPPATPPPSPPLSPQTRQVSLIPLLFQEYSSCLASSAPSLLLAHCFTSLLRCHLLGEARDDSSPSKSPSSPFSLLCSISFHSNYHLLAYHVIPLLSMHIVYLSRRMFAPKEQGFFVCFPFVPAQCLKQCVAHTGCWIYLPE